MNTTEKLPTQQNVEETDSKKCGEYRSEKMKDTPFYLRKVEEKWFLTLGKNRVSDFYETKEEALEVLYPSNGLMNWEFITTIILTIQNTKGE